MPEDNAQEVKIDQNGDKVEEDEDGEITEQARNLKTLNQYQQDILRLQNKKEQLLRQAVARHIFTITGGSNQEHENKRARREFERRVHTISPRVPLNRPAWSMVPITFDKNDFQVRDFPHTDAFVATSNIAAFTIHNILIDNGSSADILFIKPFEQMNLDKRTLEPAGNSLFGFGGKKIDALRKKAISVSVVEGEKVRTETITFDIVNMDYPYTAIFGRGVLSRFEIVIKQSYLCMKMPSPFGIIAVHGD
ncbi:unnamed protein product [Miscanthus lutarioriparius]|uniref:Uncharacterized protein n=1 Tax=Miscanthus lutarioriparius TaxID=422564 RepID=A0A811QNC1_9POAL|nr:unnamed protein product [Miscanthus lutarioriparius]